ncbi:DNA-binding protein [Deltaproteobacteria bacterium Smac51]|nr:DNA-binding protein [Deltaproteobacteria bacterium Smac51]
MKVVVDTNIVIDVLTDREPFVMHSENVFNIIANNRLQAAITANTITDIAYLLRKHCHDLQIVRNSLANLMELFEVIEVSKERCVRALDLPINDFEDALLAECARKWGAELIITRNLKDFTSSPVPAVSPNELLEKYNPA